MVLLSSSTFACTLSNTSLGFSPLRITMMPSIWLVLSSSATVPSLGLPDSITLATFLTNNGTPFIFVMIILLISPTSFNTPMPRTIYAWPLRSITSPPTFILLLFTAVKTSSAVRLYLISSSGLTLTSNIFSSPPKLFTSATPDTLLNCLSSTQSCNAVRSLTEAVLLCKMYL